jgi:hypothetical protein
MHLGLPVHVPLVVIGRERLRGVLLLVEERLAMIVSSLHPARNPERKFMKAMGGARFVWRDKARVDRDAMT